LAGGRDDSTNHTKDFSWKYPEFETYGVRRRQDLEDMRDIKTILKKYKEFAPINEILNKTCLDNIEPNLLGDLEWRAGHLRNPLNHWNLVYGDLPHQLSSGPSLQVNTLRVSSVNPGLNAQVISTTDLYKHAHLVRYPFRTFHRADGMSKWLFAFAVYLTINRIHYNVLSWPCSRLSGR
jgi:hypothetical protein